MVRDRFERPDGPIGETETGQPWIEMSGTWTLTAGRAVAAPQYEQQVCTAVVDAGVPDGRVEVAFTLSPTSRRANARVVLRFVDNDTNLFVKLERTSVNPDGMMAIGKKQDAAVTYFRSRTRRIRFDNGDAVGLVVDLAGPEVRARASTGEELSHVLDSADFELFGSVTSHGLRINMAPDDDDGGSSFDEMRFVPPS
ncbi:MAG TPA: hypothetical protein VF129_03200 [Actinomycetota bacterium]